MTEPKTRPTPLTAAGLVKALVGSARPKQWTKNLLVFFALVFSFNEGWQLSAPVEATDAVAKSVLAFALFCALSSAIYIFNDLADIENDRQHPSKRHRPIASGQLPAPLARAVATVLLVVGIALSFLLEPLLGGVAAVYAALMLAYTYVLKNVVLLDVFSISAGFVLRAVAGAAALDVPISPWLYSCTGLGALLIALGKRRSELVTAGHSAEGQRKGLRHYSIELIDQFIAIVAPSTLLAYTLYTFTATNLPENHAMMLTIPFVVYGLFRYIYLMHEENRGENPEDLLVTDVPLIISNAAWIVTAATILIIHRG